MKLDIVTYPDPVLRDSAADIPEITPEIKRLAQDMVQSMYEGNGIGLAAPQVGESLRLITVDISGPDKREDLLILLNPKILSKDGKVESEEGCLSFPELRAVVERAENVVVEALDLDGHTVALDADGLLAICLQHEIDHLNGKLIIDHVSRLKRSLYEKKAKKWKKQTARS